jgi:hypothetical protein
MTLLNIRNSITLTLATLALVISTTSTAEDFNNLNVNDLKGEGIAYVCVDSRGTIFRSLGACDLLEEISTDSGSVSKDDAKGWDMKKTEAL